MNFQNKTEFLNSLVKKEDEVKKALTKLYQGVRATNKFLGLENKNSPELQSTYFMLRKEEVGELFTAIENEDKVEFLDAVVDGLVVVGYEYYLREGDNPENLIWISDNADPIHYEIEWAYNGFLSKNNYDSVLEVLESVFYQLDINHIKAVNEVLESNWSKFPTVTEFLDSMYKQPERVVGRAQTALEFIDCQISQIEKQGRYIDVYHELRYDESVGEDRVIFWVKGEKQSDGSIKEFKAPKYVKPCTFKEPDFEKCWLN